MKNVKWFNRVAWIVGWLLLPAILAADGFIVIPNPHHTPSIPFSGPFPLAVEYHRVDVKITGQVAVTSVDQSFFNPTNSRLEGYYLFPLPKEAQMKSFSMEINGKQVEAEMLPADKARQIYEDIVRRQRDPALLEYMGQGLFRARIFPIEPHSHKRVKISYQELLGKDQQTVTYLYPLNTEKFSAQPLKDVSIRVQIDSPEPLKNIYCPTHQVEVVRQGDHAAMVSFEAQQVTPRDDFKLYFTAVRDPLGFSLLSYRQNHEDGYFLLTFAPGWDKKQSLVLPKDVLLVLDTSGSMAGKKLDQARQALLYCVENLNDTDRFNIIRFSTEAESLFETLTAVNREHRLKARSFIEKLKPMGGTNIEEALNMALGAPGGKGRPALVIFLTDGKPTIGETEEEKLLAKIKARNTHQLRIFTFGIGSDLNTHLLDKIAESSHALGDYISDNEDIEIRISAFVDKIQSPVLTGLKLAVSGEAAVKDMYPRELPDLFKGGSLVIAGRYRDGGRVKVLLSGQMGEQAKRYEFFADLSKENQRNDFIPPLWAARRIGYLLEEIRLRGSNPELVDEVTQLARKFGIITPYTSYLILEDEAQQLRRPDARADLLTLGQPGAFSPQAREEGQQSFDGLKHKSGERSVQASKDLRVLSEADRVDKVQGSGSMRNAPVSGGNQPQQQILQAAGRAFYQNGKFWVDSLVQKVKAKQTQKLTAFSPEYFNLLKQYPRLAPVLALGKNIRFVHEGTLYEIIE